MEYRPGYVATYQKSLIVFIDVLVTSAQNTHILASHANICTIESHRFLSSVNRDMSAASAAPCDERHAAVHALKCIKSTVYGFVRRPLCISLHPPWRPFQAVAQNGSSGRHFYI